MDEPLRRNAKSNFTLPRRTVGSAVWTARLLAGAMLLASAAITNAVEPGFFHNQQLIALDSASIGAGGLSAYDEFSDPTLYPSSGPFGVATVSTFPPAVQRQGDLPNVFLSADEPIMRSMPVLQGLPAAPPALAVSLQSDDPLDDDPPPSPLGSASPSDVNRQAGGDGEGAIESAETLGEAPDDSPLQFLRRQTVLLPPGQCQVDLGLVYVLSEADFPVNVGGGVVAEGRLRQRLLLVPFALRVGLSRRVQGYINAPVGWSNSELAFAGIDEYDNVGGIGDINAGFNILLRERVGRCPDVIGTVGFTAPTGNADLSLVPLAPQSRLGEGFWSVLGNILVIHTYDPVVIFYGFGARYGFEDTFGDVKLEPGFEANYQFGVGFAVNERITFSTSFLGAYITEDELDDVRIAGSNLEPLALRFAVTIAECNRIVEPFATIGMTDDGARAQIGIICTY